MREQLPISLVAHTVFCERRAWLEAVGERVDSAQMEEGRAAHRAVDIPKDVRFRSTAVDVTESQLGLVGKCDVIDHRGQSMKLVEYKATPVRRIPEVTRAHVIQLALQRMGLESMGYVVSGQEVYFTNHRRSVTVDLSVDDFTEAADWVRRTRKVVESGSAPPPLVDDPRCGGCSHVGICLPDEHSSEKKQVIRRIAVANPGGDILHLTTPGSRASIRSGRVIVRRSREELASIPLERVVGLVVHGNVDVSSALLRELMWRGYSIVWCSGRGRVIGFARSGRSPNAVARARQYAAEFFNSIELARELIAPKVANQATQLRRNSRVDVAQEVGRMRQLSRQVLTATNVQQIWGYEGEAASIYFGKLPGLMGVGVDAGFFSRWPGREGRDAADPLNVAFNYAYGLLLADCIRAIDACGLDPYLGVVHTPVRNKPALALDLMEQFRPLLADSAVLSAVNTGRLTTVDFTAAVGQLRLGPTGRKALVSEYERRVTQEFTHPVFGYRVTWRRAIEIQARMLLGVLDGTTGLEGYVGIRTR